MAERDSRAIIEGLRERVLILAAEVPRMDSGQLHAEIHTARVLIDFIGAIEEMEQSRCFYATAADAAAADQIAALKAEIHERESAAHRPLAAAESARRDMQQRHDRAVDVVRGIVASIIPADNSAIYRIRANAVDAARQWLRELDAAVRPTPVDAFTSSQADLAK